MSVRPANKPNFVQIRSLGVAGHIRELKGIVPF